MCSYGKLYKAIENMMCNRNFNFKLSNETMHYNNMQLLSLLHTYAYYT